MGQDIPRSACWPGTELVAPSEDAKMMVGTLGRKLFDLGQKHRYLIILFLVETIFFLINYRLGQFYANSDISLVELHPSQEILKRFSIWQQNRGFGLELGEDAGWIVPLALYAVLSSFGFTALQMNTIGNFLIYVAPSFAAYALAYSIFFRDERRSEIAFTAGFLTSTSFSFYILAGFPLFPNRWPIIVIPFMLSSLLLAFETGKIRFWVLYTAGCYLNFGSFIGPGFLVIPLLFMVSYLTYYVLVESPQRTRDLKRLLLAGSIFVVVSLPMIIAVANLTFGSSFWQSPYLQNYTSQVFSLNQRGVDNSDLFYGFRLIGSVSWNEILSWTGQFYKPFYVVFTYNPLFLLSSFFLPVSAFASLIISGKGRGKIKTKLIFLSVLSIALLFLMKGARPPFGEVFVWLMGNVTTFSAFRQPYDKIAPTLTYVLSLCAAYAVVHLIHAAKASAPNSNALRSSTPTTYSSSSLLSFGRKRRRLLIRIILVIALIAIVVDSYPQYAGQVLYPAGFFSLPSYYSSVATHVDQNLTAFKVLGLPETYYINCYTWGYCGIALDGVNLNKPVIHNSYVGSDVYDERITTAILDEVRFNSQLRNSILKWGTNSSIFSNDLQSGAPINLDRVQYWYYLLRSSNVGQLLLRQDSTGALGVPLNGVDWERYDGLFSALEKMNAISSPRQIGNVSVYDVASFKPLIYATSSDNVYASNNYDVFLNSQFADARLHVLGSVFRYNTSIDFVSEPVPSFDVQEPARANLPAPYIYAPVSAADYLNQIANELSVQKGTLNPNAASIAALENESAWLNSLGSGAYVDFIQGAGNFNLLIKTTPVVASLLTGANIYVNNAGVAINQTLSIGGNWFEIGDLSLNPGQLVLRSHMFLSNLGRCDYGDTVTYINKLLDILHTPDSVNVSGYVVQRLPDSSWQIRTNWGGILPYSDLCSLLADSQLDADWRKSVPIALGLGPILGSSVEFALVPTSPHGAPGIPVVSFRELSPDKYVVNVENASGPFWLSFLESYNDGWKLYAVPNNGGVTGNTHWQSSFIDSSDLVALFSEPVYADQHFLSNGFANSWYVDPSTLTHNSLVKVNPDGTMTFSLLVYYHSEALFALTIVVSIAVGPIIVLGLFRKELLIRLRKRIHYS